MALNCPNCGAGVQFPYSGLAMQVCGSCRSLLRLEGQDIEAVGQSATLPFDVSAFQIGTSLSISIGDGRSARGDLVGRVRWGWQDGSWNEWLLYLPDGSIRWIAEESGLYMVMRTVKASAAQDDACRQLLEAGRSALGKDFIFQDNIYYLSDVKTVSCVSSEGALDEPVSTGYTVKTIDFRNAIGGGLTYQIEEGSGYFYVGYYAELGELDPKNLRDLEGWSRPDFSNLVKKGEKA
jgi:hypothetical protein